MADKDSPRLLGRIDPGRLLDVVADAVVAADGAGHIVYANPAIERLLGWRPQELVGQPLTTLMPQRMRAAHATGFHRYLTTRESHIIGRPVRVPALHQDGGEVDIELSISAWQPEPGQDLFVASMRDLRDRVELERQLATHRLLAAQYAVMSALTGASRLEDAGARVLEAIGTHLGWVAGVFFFAPPGADHIRLLAYWSRPGEELPTYEAKSRARTFRRGEGLPGRVWELGIPEWSEDISRDTRYLRAQEAARDGLRSALFFPVVGTREVRGVLEFVTRETLRPDEELLRSMASLGAQMGQFVERMELETAQAAHLSREQEAHAQAQEALRAREEFLSIASHELRTPLSALLLHLESLQRRTLTQPEAALGPEEMARRFELAQRQVRRLNRLVSELLDISRITAGRLDLAPEELDLVELVRGVLQRNREQIAQSGCAVHLEAPAPVPGCWDPLRLEQVMDNLLSNALKYGHGRPIHVQVEGLPEAARLVVRDQGPGIAPEHQARIFERFERAVSTRHYGGFGLGLWIVRRILEAQGGAIRVESVPGEGSTFTVELPRRVPGCA